MAFFDTSRAKMIGALLVAALCGYWAGNGHTTHNSIVEVSNQLGKARAAQGCEHWRARVAGEVANQAITAANSEDAAAPDKSALPVDCQH